jgi:hypothetical protein
MSVAKISLDTVLQANILMALAIAMGDHAQKRAEL